MRLLLSSTEPDNIYLLQGKCLGLSVACRDIVSQAIPFARKKKRWKCLVTMHTFRSIRPCIDVEAYFMCTAYETIVNMRLNLWLIKSVYV